MSDMDHQAALDISRSISANPQRTSVTSSPRRVLLPRAAKRARTSGAMVPRTPQSMPATPPQATSPDPASSPLSSPPTSERSFTFCELSIKDLPDTPLPVSKRGQQGITNITISEGDRRSQPQPGTELLQMVEEAKIRGELAKIYDSSIVRRINGEWMAPQMCNR
jgi:hypothetical protein